MQVTQSLREIHTYFQTAIGVGGSPGQLVAKRVALALRQGLDFATGQGPIQEDSLATATQQMKAFVTPTPAIQQVLVPRIKKSISETLPQLN